MTATPYDSAFFANVAGGSLESARVVAPLVAELVQPRSVVDVGCGVGTWLRAFVDLGVTDYLGLDGDYVNRADLKISADRFRAADLTDPPPLGRTFDLAVCLEVAEHLPGASADRFVGFLTAAAPVVLFSAALPGQGGTSHVNEQWPKYWCQRFEARGYVRLDPVRPRVWRDRRVEWWYQQNICLYATAAAVASSPRLGEEAALARDFPYELLHGNVFDPLVRATTARGMVTALPRAVLQAVRHAMRRTGG